VISQAFSEAAKAWSDPVKNDILIGLMFLQISHGKYTLLGLLFLLLGLLFLPGFVPRILTFNRLRMSINGFRGWRQILRCRLI